MITALHFGQIEHKKDRNTQELIALSVARLHLLPVAAQTKAAICVFLKAIRSHAQTHIQTFGCVCAQAPVTDVTTAKTKSCDING